MLKNPIHCPAFLLYLLLMLCPATQNLANDEIDHSLNEMDSAKTQFFDATESKKHAPLDFRITYPESWRFIDLNIPGEIGRLISDANPEMAWVRMKKKMLPDKKKQAPSEVFDSGFFLEYDRSASEPSQPKQKLIKAEQVTLGSRQGAIVEFYRSTDMPGTDLKIRQHVATFFFIQNGHLVEIQYNTSLSLPEDQATDNMWIKSSARLWESILKTLVVR